MRLGSFRSAGENALTRMADNASQKVPVRSRAREPRYVYWMQGIGTDGVSLDMPDNTKDFEAIIFPFKCLVTSVHISTTAGTYTVRLKYNGSATGESYTNSMSYPRPVRPALLVAPGNRLTLTCTTSSSVKDFIARFTIREV